MGHRLASLLCASCGAESKRMTKISKTKIYLQRWILIFLIMNLWSLLLLYWHWLNLISEGECGCTGRIIYCYSIGASTPASGKCLCVLRAQMGPVWVLCLFLRCRQGCVLLEAGWQTGSALVCSDQFLFWTKKKAWSSQSTKYLWVVFSDQPYF